MSRKFFMIALSNEVDSLEDTPDLAICWIGGQVTTFTAAILIRPFVRSGQKTKPHVPLISSIEHGA
jgi:hypothetical protein